MDRDGCLVCFQLKEPYKEHIWTHTNKVILRLSTFTGCKASWPWYETKYWCLSLSLARVFWEEQIIAFICPSHRSVTAFKITLHTHTANKWKELNKNTNMEKLTSSKRHLFFLNILTECALLTFTRLKFDFVNADFSLLIKLPQSYVLQI